MVWLDTASILGILDDCYESLTFAFFEDTGFSMAASRLSLYRSDRDWAIAIERFGYSAASGIPGIIIQTFASRLQERDWHRHYRGSPDTFETYLAHHPHDEFRTVDPIEDGPWLDPEHCYLVAGSATDLVLRGRRIALPGMDSYLDAGVTRASATELEVIELCRVLAAEHRDAVLATPEERRVNIPPELQPILTLQEWRHPRALERRDGELVIEQPGDSETFQQLAEVLVTGDPAAYAPTQTPNTHWRHWPDLGV